MPIRPTVPKAAVPKAVPNRVPAGGPRTVIPIKGPAKPQTPLAKPAVSRPAVPVGARPAAPRPKVATPKPVPARTAPAAPAPAAPKAANWINRTVQNSVAGVGAYGANYVYSLGGRVNGIGEAIGMKITDATRNMGQGVAGYGNTIKDQVGVVGTRAVTGGNPLGIAGTGSSQAQGTTGVVRNAGKGAAGNHLGI